MAGRPVVIASRDLHARALGRLDGPIEPGRRVDEAASSTGGGLGRSSAGYLLARRAEHLAGGEVGVQLALRRGRILGRVGPIPAARQVVRQYLLDQVLTARPEVVRTASAVAARHIKQILLPSGC